jgi:hypothetical protein
MYERSVRVCAGFFEARRFFLNKRSMGRSWPYYVFAVAEGLGICVGYGLLGVFLPERVMVLLGACLPCAAVPRSLMSRAAAISPGAEGV